MMADFNSSFLNHLKKSEQERKREQMKFNWKKRHVIYPGEKLLRKYKRKIWQNKPHRKKIRETIQNKLLKNGVSESRYTWPSVGHCVLNKRHAFDSAVLPEIGHCKDFPISEMGAELTGNRNNGNSPFSGSTSCGSPPDSQLLCKVEKTVVRNNQCQKCSVANSEQNNNTELRCTCIVENDVKVKVDNESCKDSVKSEQFTDSEMDECDKCMDTENSCHGDGYIDVESLDESGEGKVLDDSNMTECSHKVTEVFENGLVDQPVQYVGSNVKHSQPSTQIAPVKWQQQFMSFLSSSTPGEEELVETNHHHSPRRKRSRKIRQSMCPCCMGSGEHHKKKDDLVRYRKSHSAMRDHRRFIRDMTQLVSLRNKVMAICKVLFPQCVGEVFNYANPDSEDVDKCIDQMISILHNAHQQFLHNMNSNCEKSKSINRLKKFKSVSKGKLKYEQKSSNEILVSICDPSKPEKDSSKPVNTLDQNIADECVHPAPILYLPQPDQVNDSMEGERSSLFSNLCLPGSGENIVYAIPVENGIANLDQTQVLLTDDTPQNLNFVSDRLFSVQNESANKDKDEINHTRMLSEADSGIVNDHDVSSPEDVEKTELLHDRSLLWSDTMDQSKTNTDSAKTEQTANIFDLLSKCEPTKTIEKHELPLNSSQEETKSSIKTPVKSADRNIFDSLFNMNIESYSSPKCVQKEEDQICDEEIDNFYFPVDNPENDDLGSISLSPEKPKDIYVEVYDPAIRLCKKPKICLRAFKEKTSVLLRWLLPEIAFEKNFFKNVDNVEYVLDALILSNQKNAQIS